MWHSSEKLIGGVSKWEHGVQGMPCALISDVDPFLAWILKVYFSWVAASSALMYLFINVQRSVSNFLLMMWLVD